MNIYRVEFDNDKAISATLIGTTLKDEVVSADAMENDTGVKWLLVLATDEQDSIRSANEMIKGF